MHEPIIIVALEPGAPTETVVEALKWWAAYYEEFHEELDWAENFPIHITVLNPANYIQHPVYGSPLWEQTTGGYSTFTEQVYKAPDAPDAWHGYISSEAVGWAELQ